MNVATVVTITTPLGSPGSPGSVIRGPGDVVSDRRIPAAAVIDARHASGRQIAAEHFPPQRRETP